MPLDSILSNFFACSCFIIAIYLLHRRATEDRVVPDALPWFGLRNELFSTLRGHLRDWTDAQETIRRGYSACCRNNKAFVVPKITFRPEVVLPQSHIRWLVEQPDNHLSIAEVLQDNLEFSYTSPGAWSFKNPFHVEALNKMRLDSLMPEMYEEVVASIDGLWGRDSCKWRNVPVFDTLQNAIIRITNRIFVGAELHRNKEYVEYARSFIESLPYQAMMIRLFVPTVLKPIFGPILALPCRYYIWRCSTFLLPVIRQKVEEAKQSSKGDPIQDANDGNVLQLIARLAVKNSDAVDSDTYSICSRLLSLNFVGIHTSTFTIVNTIFDIMGSESSEAILETLRREAKESLRQSDNVWTKSAVSRLTHIDSAIRESLRISGFKAKGLERHVVAKNGVTLPDGTHLPQDTRVGVPASEIHYDERFYPDPTRYDAFRFCKERTNLAMANTSDTFLAFGHGRHACPGRFFSACELKLLLAYVVLNYDIKPLRTRPNNLWASDFCVPSTTATVSVRRRAHV